MKKRLSFWQRNKFKLNGVLLLLPIWFLYRSLTPELPVSWSSVSAGPFEVEATPADMAPAYLHHGEYVKDFALRFIAGEVSDIRQGYLNIGPEPLALEVLQQGESGILHGSRHGQHVHAIAPAAFGAADKLWLTVEDWHGRRYVAHWPLPSAWVLVQ
ncbi:hypothetical protein [Shewanella algae]|uniref:Uncharacterized protein n=1 Tax=Shewanella algae TaxID=38313 RepID=A0A7T8INZ7_9GAMM|nr:hypothetical protein [Shewanella algae]MBO2564230.1 hypothetical protein [Shewanella algae]MBO2695319.1 hypothetical protein [Shewanella algae]QQO82718.1 hypothetical protein D7032_05315 [Shewanella algae]